MARADRPRAEETRERWELRLRESHGDQWVDEHKARLDLEWEYIESLGIDEPEGRPTDAR